MLVGIGELRPSRANFGTIPTGLGLSWAKLGPATTRFVRVRMSWARSGKASRQQASLAFMRASFLRCLANTASLMAKQGWGVGILGLFGQRRLLGSASAAPAFAGTACAKQVPVDGR